MSSSFKPRSRRLTAILALVAIPLMARSADIDRFKVLIASIASARQELSRLKIEHSKQRTELSQRKLEVRERSQKAARELHDYRAEAASLRDQIAAARARLKASSAPLPLAPLRRALRAAAQTPSIESSDDATPEPLSKEGLNAILALLGSCQDQLRLSGELRVDYRDLTPFPDGRLVHSRFLRIGSLLSAWLSEDGLLGGIAAGAEAEKGHWTPLDALGRAQIAALIEVLSNQRPAELLPLPLPDSIPRRKDAERS